MPEYIDTDCQPLIENMPVGLLEVDIGRSYGLRLYLPVIKPDYLLTHPDLPIYRDTQHAVSKLSSSLRAPSGMSRVFYPPPFLRSKAGNSIFMEYRAKILDINQADVNSHHGVGLLGQSLYGGYHVWSHCSGRTLPEWHPGLNRCIAVLDTPLITDASAFQSSSLTLYPTLTCLSLEIHEALLQRDEFSEGPPGIFGLPTIKGVTRTKTGAIRRKPGTKIRADADAALLARGSSISTSLTTFAAQLSELINRDHLRHLFPYRPLNARISHESRRRASQTLDDRAAQIHSQIRNLRLELQSLLDENFDHQPMCRGILRTRLIYLRSLHAPAVNSLLASISHILPILRAYPTTGYRNRIDPTADRTRSLDALELHRALYRLALAMIPGRSDRFMFPTPAATAAERLSTNDGQ